MSQCSKFFLSLSLLTLAAPAWSLRIVTLLPSNTEIVESLGAGDEIVGVSVFDTKVSTRQTVGDFIQPNIEAIVSLKPDIILAGRWQTSRAAPRLQQLGYRVVEVANPKSLAELDEDVRQVAQTIGRQKAAEDVVAHMHERLTLVQQRAARLRRRARAFLEIDRGGWTAGGADFLTEALRIAGADNIFSDVKKQAAQVSPEAIVARDPDVIICLDASDDLTQRPSLASLRAIRERHVLSEKELSVLARPSPRIVDGIERLEQDLEQVMGVRS